MSIKKYLNIILFGVNVIISLSLFSYLLFMYHYDAEVLESNIPVVTVDEKEEINNIISVEVKGAVEHPGVFQMNSQQIINDVISLAGGFKKDAYTNNINLSKHLIDEMVVYVYTKNEYVNIQKDKEVQTQVCQKEVINMCIENGDSIIVSGSDISIVNANDLVNINTASKEELTTLNGIGEAKAQSIIDYRTQNGPFSSIKDILKVSGISQTIYDKIKNNITV